MRIAIIDSSCLINLTHLQLAKNLSLYFDIIYVPRKVHAEVNRKSKFRYQLKKLYRTRFFKRCISADQVRVDLLIREIDPGEAEGLVQAQEKHASFFIADDKRAREISERQGLTPVGTARLIARLHKEGYASDTRLLVRKLERDLHFRVSPHVVEQAILSAEAPI